jgi:hypothetical protein
MLFWNTSKGGDNYNFGIIIIFYNNFFAMNHYLLNSFWDSDIIVALIGVVSGAIGFLIRYFIERSNKSKSVNRALLSEVSRLIRVIKHHKPWWEKCIKEGNTDLPLINFSTEVYDIILKNWGDVDHLYAGEAASFYGYIKFLNRLQASRKKYPAGKESLFAGAYKDGLDALNKEYEEKFDKAFTRFQIKYPED